MCRPTPGRTRSVAIGSLLSMALATVISCGGDDGPSEPQVPATVNVSPSSAEMSSFGEMLQLNATVLDRNGQTIAGAAVNWASSDNSVATVDAGGVVTSVQNGDATVTATSGGATGTASIAVAQRPAQISLTPDAAMFVSIGDTVRLGAEAVDANGNAVADLSLTWASEDDAVATVDAEGLVTAAGNGSANVTASAGTASGAAAITVSQVIVALDVMPAAANLFSLGDTLRLVASGVDANGHTATGLSVTWMSEHDAVASVDEDGLVTALRTGGTDIFAESGEYRDSAGVTVTQLAAEVRVTPAVDTLAAVGDTVRLGAVALDANGNEVDDTDYVWTAPHPAVVTVDETGLVTAAGTGTGEIRVKATRAGANHIGVAVITVLETGTSSASAGGARSAQPARRLPLLRPRVR